MKPAPQTRRSATSHPRPAGGRRAWRPGARSFTAAVALALALAAMAPHAAAQDRFPPMVLDSVALSPDTGSFTALTYNVAGLPPGVSKSKPLQNMPRISPLLAKYDLVLVQEDFFFHSLLAISAGHPYQSAPQATSRIFSKDFLNLLLSFPSLNVDGILGIMSDDRVTSDGLNRFSRFPFEEHRRETWSSCNGLTGGANDCLATKGFTYARHQVAPGVTVDVYNVHADAGRRDGDIAAREKQFQQLAAFIALHSEGQAVLVGGDTNLQSPVPGDEKIIQDFMAATGTRVAARTLGQEDVVDRFFYRGGLTLELEAVERAVADEFVDGSGNPLSDHPAIRVRFQWKRLGPSVAPTGP